MGRPSLSIYFASVAVMFSQPAVPQSAFAVESTVTVRADSFACKETSDWIACFNATEAAASRQEHSCTIISRRTNALV
jgi:hypothetical protein